MLGLTRHLRAVGLAVIASCSSGSSDAPMKSPQTKSADNQAGPLGPFATLPGSVMALVAGPTSAPVVALHRKNATWWTGTTATEIKFDDAGPVGGSVWVDGGKRLRVGLGTIDLASKSFAIEPALQSFVRDVNRLGDIAWFPDGARVALLINAPSVRTDRPMPRVQDPTKRELVIVSLTGTEPPVRRTITVEGTPGIAAGDDRVIVTGNSTQLFDARAVPVPVAFALPEFVGRSSFSAGKFVLVSGDGTITLLDARSGSSLAAWGGPGIHDAVATGNTIVAVDLQGAVHVGCVAGNVVREVAKASAGSVADMVQVVGNRVVVSADGPDPIRVATLTSPCPP